MRLALAAGFFAALALMAADDSWAGGSRGGRGGGHRGGAHLSGAHRGIAHHPHFVGRSIFVGVPFYYPGPYYYYPPPPNYFAPPPVYIEQYPGTPAPQSQDWYFCPSAGAYYPYVTDCPGGWQRVVPSQPAQPSPVG